MLFVRPSSYPMLPSSFLIMMTQFRRVPSYATLKQTYANYWTMVLLPTTRYTLPYNNWPIWTAFTFSLGPLKTPSPPRTSPLWRLNIELYTATMSDVMGLQNASALTGITVATESQAKSPSSRPAAAARHPFQASSSHVLGRRKLRLLQSFSACARCPCSSHTYGSFFDDAT